MKLIIFLAICMATNLVLPVVNCLGQGNSSASKTITGEYYDWTKTMKPENPWNHDYDQTLVMKMFLCSRGDDGGVDKVYLDFEQALEVVRKLDNLTLGVPKIIYLVGWQFNGHDSKYPAWNQVNNALKREQDETSLQSLKWLMKEAKKYNTTVSLHVNMIDAFKDSPLWEEYFEKDIIAKDINGAPIPGETFNGMTSYQISYTQEWEMGLAQKRIDNLLKMLPELKDAGTVHIDAFHSIRPAAYKEGENSDEMSPFLGYSIDQEIATQRKIFRYWKIMGVDVTAEGGMYWLRKDPFIGLQPFAWHFEPENFKSEEWHGKPEGFQGLPSDLYCGTPMHAEGKIMEDPINLNGIKEEFCTKVVPWFMTNKIKKTGKKNVIWKFENGEVYLPVSWANNKLLVFTENGFKNRKLKLPEHWKGLDKVFLYSFGVNGTQFLGELTVRDLTVNLSLKQGDSVLIFKDLENSNH
ncbi:endo-alpha-N-acetylgalactosaminidase family protein [Echinicola sp. 20G]|uniref:endo-alpha-N-acetylgalactosaminidase family protein n=1 Tax=Echinicola sp. 20G TaxID=2781961 RepID=UPI00190FE93D|nr:endo-alpha-N-acetylgalactosaminidase family protein [Echinicola sp. 20G]